MSIKQVFSVILYHDEVLEVGQIGVPIMKALHLDSIIVEKSETDSDIIGCNLCHCPTVIIRDGVHCVNCGHVYQSHRHDSLMANAATLLQNGE